MPNNEKVPFLKKEVTLGQVLSIGVVIISAMFTSWLDINTKIAEHEIRIHTLEKTFDSFITEYKTRDDKNAAQREKLFDIVSSIRADLNNKENRK